MLDIEFLLKDKNSTATVIIPKKVFRDPKQYEDKNNIPRLIKGLLLNGSFDIGGGNTFAVPTEIGSDALAVANKSINLFSGTMASRNFSKPVINRQFTTGFANVKSWQSSEDFKFSLQLGFVSITSQQINDTVSGTDNVLLPVLDLLSLVYPIPLGSNNTNNLVYEILAPAGYSPPIAFNPAVAGNEIEEARTVSGVVQVVLGNFMRLRNMVCESVQVNLSREIQKNGTPLFATVNLEFSCYRTMYYDDIVNLFNMNLNEDAVKRAREIAELQGKNSGDIINPLSQGAIQGINKGVEATQAAAETTFRAITGA